MSVKKLNEILNEKMQNKGLTSVDLSKITGIGVSTIQKIRSGLNDNPTIDNLIKIANYFNITTSELIGEVESSTYFKVPIIEWSHLRNFINIVPSEYLYAQGNVANCFAVRLDLNFGRLSGSGAAVVNPNKKFKHGDLVLVLKNQIDIPALKKIVIDGFDNFLESLNPVTTHLEKLSEEYMILGVVNVLFYFKDE